MNEIDEALQRIEAQEAGINVDLLARVADYIEVHAEEFDMDNWAKDEGGWLRQLGYRLGVLVPRYTVGCVACHTVRLGGGDEYANIPAQAQRLLRLTDEQAHRLFYWGKWPKFYKHAYRDYNNGSTARAWISAQRFRHFIKTNGAK